MMIEKTAEGGISPARALDEHSDDSLDHLEEEGTLSDRDSLGDDFFPADPPDIVTYYGRRSALGLVRPRVYRVSLPKSRIEDDALKVIRRLTQAGHVAYLVGGGVRDLLLGKRPKDFDVGTSARPEQVRRLFRNCHIVGRRFRLAHVYFGKDRVIETATFRREPKPGDDENNPLLIRRDNAYGEPHEDANRRDFTINGLFYDLGRNEVIDYVGGVPDLRQRTLRTIREPSVRLQEDPVRILRAIKFSARLDLGIAPELHRQMVCHRESLRLASKPRVFEEVLRLMRGGAASRSIYLLWEMGGLSVLLPQLAAYLDDEGVESNGTWRALRAVDMLKKADSLPDDAVLLAALMRGPVEEWLEDAEDPSVAFEDFFRPITETLSVPRRIKDRVRLLIIAQRKLRRGRFGGMNRREYFRDSATLHAIECYAKGKPLPDWMPAELQLLH